MSAADVTKQFFMKYPRQSYSDGHVLLTPDDAPEGIYFLESGHVKQYDIASNGDEVVVNHFRPGAHFPMNWAINQQPNEWYLEADGDIVLHIAPVEDTMEFFRNNYDSFLLYVQRLCSGATGQQRRMAHLMGGSARSRVLFELITEFRRFGNEHGKELTINISETELAAKAGLSREAVNRELSKLKSEGLVTRKYRAISTASIEPLQEQLGQAL